MRRTRAALALAQIAFVAATAFSARAVYAFAHGVCTLVRSEESSPDADVQQPIPRHLARRDFTRISNICEAFR